MSDYSISIVPRQSSYPNNGQKAKEILDWLVSRNIVKPALSDCISSSEKGYAISEGALIVASFPEKSPYDLLTNGLEIVTERRVFSTGQNGMDKCICPNCNENIAFDDCDLDPWYSQESDNLTCPICGKESEIHNYQFEPEWGFSDLGFIFWNWPDFSTDFLDEFKKKFNCEICIVKQHI